MPSTQRTKETGDDKAVVQLGREIFEHQTHFKDVE